MNFRSKRSQWVARQGAGRKAYTYRGAKRNLSFGRKPVGNTKPHERRFIEGREG